MCVVGDTESCDIGNALVFTAGLAMVMTLSFIMPCPPWPPGP